MADAEAERQQYLEELRAKEARDSDGSASPVLSPGDHNPHTGPSPDPGPGPSPGHDPSSLILGPLILLSSGLGLRSDPQHCSVCNEMPCKCAIKQEGHLALVSCAFVVDDVINTKLSCILNHN